MSGNPARASLAASAAAPDRLASFKQYRDDDGKFYFKLFDADGKLLLQSIGHGSARAVGQLIARLKSGVAGELRQVRGSGLHLGEELLGAMADSVEIEQLLAALATFAEAAIQARSRQSS